MSGDMIKVNVIEGGQKEHLWAKLREDGLAVIQNVPFLSTTVSYKDVVRFCPDHGTVIEVVESTFKNASIAYQGEKEEYLALRESLSKSGVEIEGMVAGLCSAAFPKHLTLEEVADIAQRAGGMLISKDEMKFGVMNSGNTRGCACCGKNLGKGGGEDD